MILMYDVANMTPESLQVQSSQVALEISVKVRRLASSSCPAIWIGTNLGITGRPRARWGVWINTFESIRIIDNLPHSKI